MGADAALELVDSLVFAQTGRHLNDLQRTLLKQVWQGQKYWQIAQHLGYTEGHIKDVAAFLWQLLSEVLKERISKGTLRAALERRMWDSVLVMPKGAPATLPELLPGSLTLVGREEAIADLDRLIQQGNRLLVIQGEGGLGKTTLAQHYLDSRPFDRVLELLMAKETADILPIERVVEEWLKQDFGVEPGWEFGITLDRLKRQLMGQRVGVLIDNLEPALDAQGCFIAGHSRYRELLRVLTDARSQTITLVTSRDRLCEPGIRATHYRLPGLSVLAWEQFYQQRQLAIDPASLQAMQTAYGGNAKAMEILAGIVQEDFAGDVAAYWQGQGQDLLSPVDLKNLVESQVARLRALDPDAYRVFCRLGAFRYQAVPTVPVAAIIPLMADLPSDRHRAILNSLRHRSLVECCQNRYWLHPVVRATAIAHLRASADWELANRVAADFWSRSVLRISSIEAALQALEAYYHYLAIADYPAAARVILYTRSNQWGQFLPLGSTLYRMGLIQPVLEAITTTIGHLPRSNADTSELYNILGDLYWITGQVRSAITCQENAIDMAQSCLATETAADSRRGYYLTMLAVDSRLSLGLYQLDLGDLAAAAQLLQQVIDETRHTAHVRWAEKAMVCLALVHAYQGQLESARHLAETIEGVVLEDQQTGRNAFFVQILGQTQVALGQLDRAEALFEHAIAAAEAGHYIQIKAQSLIGLGKVERLRGNWPRALEYHQGAIDLLEELGAQCDLAEAHYQLGLTYQAMQQAEQTTHFRRAIRLFAAIEAPYQVNKVEAALSL